MAPAQTPTCIDSCLQLYVHCCIIVEASVKEAYYEYCVYGFVDPIYYYSTLADEVHTTQELYLLTKDGNVTITVYMRCVDTQHYHTHCNNTTSKQMLQRVLL